MGATRDSVQKFDSGNTADASRVAIARESASEPSLPEGMGLRLFRAATGDGRTLPSGRIACALRQAPATTRIQLAHQLQRHYGNGFVQRMVDDQTEQAPEEERKRQEQETGSELQLQTAGMSAPEPSAGSVVNEALSGTSQQGQPLDGETRDSMERAFGRDLGNVRTHTGPEAERASDALGARAFTAGGDIYFGRGQYQPGTAEGDRLLAHELAHTVQQSNAPAPSPQSKLTVSDPGDADEREAEAVAQRVAHGSNIQAANLSTNPVLLQRQKPAAATPPAPAQAGGPPPITTVVDLKTAKFENPPEEVATAIAAGKRKGLEVPVKFGSLAEGKMIIRREKDTYEAKQQPLILSHPLFREFAAQGLNPRLFLWIDNGEIKGRIGLEGKKEIADVFKESPQLLGLAGFDLSRLPKLINTVEEGKLKFGAQDIAITLGGAFSGTATIVAEDAAITFAGQATVNVKGLATGTLDLNRSAEGAVTGKATVALQLPKNFSGNVDVAWDGRAIAGEGKIGYQGEKLSGQVTLRLMERGQAEQLEREKKAPPEEAAAKQVTPAEAPAPKAKGKPKKVDYVVFGEGDLTFAFTEWLNGTAHVIVDHKAFVTIIGKITPQKEFILFEQRDYIKPIFKLEARASYGLPVVGNIFIFANIGMDAFAKLGPAKFYNIVVEGTYSTDPEKNKDFSVRGSLNISAAAGLRLRAEAGVGLEILDHDIKAGAGINGIAGIRGYAEATPIIGYREQAKAGEDKKGEFYIRGELEIAAQPFLGLSGDVFIELDTPWWSPLSDDKWTWPLGSKEWPIGGTFGIKAGVDYVFGSNQLPSIEFGKVQDFSADKFMTDMYEDKAKPKSAEAEDQKGKWNEKNSQEADVPKPTAKGDATPGKLGAESAAQPTVKPGGPKKAGTPVDANAKTVEGKSVKELQEEASKKGKKPEGKGIAKGAEKEEATQKGKDKQAPDEELKQGLAALEAVTQRYAEDGATKEEVETGVKSVRRKFKVFKSIEVIDGNDTWDYEYEINPKVRKKGSKKKTPNRFKATRRPDDTIEGKWEDFIWTNYPDHAVTPHPANKEYGHKNGAKVPQPRGGKYVVGKKFSRTSEGAQHTDDWRNRMNLERDDHKDDLAMAHPDWSKSMIDREGKKTVEVEYGMPWLDLYLTGWQAHHIRPVYYWNGSDVDSNMQYLKEVANDQNPKTGEHSPFKPWWDKREKELESEVV